MKFLVTRESLLEGLQFIIGVVERRQSMPILANILLKLSGNQLFLTGTDLEIELTSTVNVEKCEEEGQITVPGRKLVDICRSLLSNEEIVFETKGEKALIQAGKSRFSLAILPAVDFPLTAMPVEKLSFEIEESKLHQLMAFTSFGMAQQDVRYYLNGLFFEITSSALTTVATDGHRLASYQSPFQHEKEATFILPRKGVVELLRILKPTGEQTLKILCAENALKIEGDKFTFVSRLIDGRFPDYKRVIPKNLDKTAHIDRDLLKQVLQRVSILTHEKYHAARLCFNDGMLSLTANNTENEEAQDEISIHYNGPSVEIAFNIHYLLDVLNVLPQGNVQFHFSGPENSILLSAEDLSHASYVIMPMSL